MDREEGGIRGQTPYRETSERIKRRPARAGPSIHRTGAARPASHRAPRREDSGATGETVWQSSHAEGSGLHWRTFDHATGQKIGASVKPIRRSGRVRLWVVERLSARQPNAVECAGSQSGLHGQVTEPSGKLIPHAPTDPMQRGDAVRIQNLCGLTAMATLISPTAAQGRRCAGVPAGANSAGRRPSGAASGC